MTEVRIPFEMSLESPQGLEAARVVDRLVEAGFTAYFAGGCVRDALLEHTPKDFDVATDAPPATVRRVFGAARTLAFGASFGVIGVLPDASHSPAPATTHAPEDQSDEQPPSSRVQLQTPHKIGPTEVATFRSDGAYSDGRRPDTVRYGDAAADARRRDFTINGLFYDPIRRVVIDHVRGRRDLESRILRTIGSPVCRFDEDKLRMLRAIRFATTKGFTIAPETLAAIRTRAATIGVVSGERIGQELRRTLSSESASSGIGLLRESGLLKWVWPQLCDAAPERVAAALDSRPPECVDFVVALVAASVASRARTPAANSESPAAEASSNADLRWPPRAIVEDLTERWKLSREEARSATAAMELHPTLIQADRLPWSVVQPVLVHRDAEIILDVARTMVRWRKCPADGIELCHQAIGWSPARLNPPPLLSGDHLRALGYPPGPMFRVVLEKIRDAQLNEEIHSPAEAIELADRTLSGT